MMITRLWAAQPGAYFCVAAKGVSWKGDKFFRPREFSQIEDYLAEHRGHDLYACPHGFTGPRRIKEFAVPPSLLWADLDEADPRALPVKPTIAIQSSPGRYVGVWQTDAPVTEHLNKRLTYAVGADRSGWAFTKLLRLLLGTRNHKYASQPKVKLLWDDGPDYRVNDLERELPTVAGVSRSPIRASDSAPTVTLEEGKRVARKYGLGTLYLGPCGDRSKAVFKIVERMASKGATPEQAFAVVMISRAAERFDGDRQRAWKDVLNIMSKHREHGDVA